MWDKAENKLREVLNDIGIPYVEKIGEAAFYGPKLDVQVKPAVGNEYTLSTCQLDFCLPAKFDLTYVDKDGSKKTPVVIHRAILGSIDRFIAFYLEETKGALPLWLSPVQVSVLPVNNEYHLDYAKEIVKELELHDIRVELNDKDEKLGYRMRENQVRKIPVSVVIGNQERDERLVTLRYYGSEEKVTMSLDEFITYVVNKRDTRALEMC
jgi:threonyl-tRNA synthetase